jgi:hypothetical protein
MKESSIRDVLARVMLWGTLLAAALMLAGLAWYASAHAGTSPGGHIFRGEPRYFENPVAMVQRTLEPDAEGHRRALLMLGILLLLLNPVVRVALAGLGFLASGDRLYTVVSGVVLAVLLYSLFS